MADNFVDIDADASVVQKSVFVEEVAITAEAHESRLVADYEVALRHLRDGDKERAKGTYSQLLIR